MNGLRIALITRRFWPLVGGPERALALLATGLRERGAEPLIVTPQWDSEWPQQAAYQGTPIVRLPHPPESRLAALRYMLTLRRWLRQHRERLDLVCVSQLRIESYVAVGALHGSGIRVVLRAERAGLGGDCQWQNERRLSGCLRRRCRAADALIATSAAVQRELVANGYAPDRIRVIPDGIAAGDGNGGKRAEARTALAETNAELNALADTAVVVYVGRLAPEQKLRLLLRAWPAVLRARPLTKLWLVGDGPDRDALYQLVKDYELQHTVILPGTFDDIQEVLWAADLFVYPAGATGPPRALLEAVAAGLPVVAVESPDLRDCPALNETHVAFVPASDAAALAEGIVRTLAEPADADTLRIARRRVLEQYAVSAMVEEHLALFASLLGQKPPR